MIEVIRTTDATAYEAFRARLQSRSVSADAELLVQVSNVIAEVRKRGDAALLEYTARFDGVALTQLRVSPEAIDESAKGCDADVLLAMREAIANVRSFHERQREHSWQLPVGNDSFVGQRITPINSVGLYVPGGTAAYPSSVLMNAIPAIVAGVPRIVVVTPPGAIESNAAVAAALRELEITEVYAIGGAQAIAALAYGTESIARVDKITGPGNKYVAAAKKLVFGDVGIDSIAGPSEVVIVADDSARADFVAADLLAQAEHGEDASALVITTSEFFASAVQGEVARQVESLPRAAIVKASLESFGAIVIVENTDAAAAIVNELAPEHVELITAENDRLVELITDAGAIFLGPYSPEALGDYFAGPNHVLPTGSTARFASALGVYDFVKRTSLISYSESDMSAVATKIAIFAEAEGLSAHARSAAIRRTNRGDAESAERVPRVIKSEVRDLKAYSLSPDRATVKLNQNENPFDAPGPVKAETLRLLSNKQWSRYPDFVPEELHQTLATFSSWRPDGILAGNGSNELIQALLMVAVEKGKRVLICEPTFALYRQVTTVLGGEVISVLLDDEFKFDAGTLIKQMANSQPEVVIICSPNNPTGSVIDEQVLREVLRVAPGLVVIDEAYHEFAESSVVPLLSEFTNLVVLRTFSKALALAAFRVGYLLASPELVTNIRKALLPYNLNVFSQLIAQVSLEMYETECLPLVRTLISERGRLFGELQAIDGLTPVASRANFMIVRSVVDPKRVFRELLARDILIRDVSGYPKLKDYFRVSVGTPGENDLLIQSLKEIMRR